jgi:pantoate--beta-alanine ligase
MITVATIVQTRVHVQAARRSGLSVGFVPTMGALHRGHMALVHRARRSCGHVVVSIFVNPTQFGPGEDFERYPRPLQDDLRECQDAGVHVVFAPDTAEMYGQAPLTTVTVRDLSAPLCGRFRPGHFDGVCTVVAKLFHIVAPDAAFFGEKDYQQLTLIRRMVADLNVPIEIVACPTVREEDGLAISSRNRYLSPPQRRQAAGLYQALREAAETVAAGQTDAGKLCEAMRRRILDAGPADIDYVTIVDPDTLANVARVDRPVRICLAVRIGGCRLIDNLAVDVGTPRR